MSVLLSVGVLLTTAGAVLAGAPVHTHDTLTWPDEVALECDGFLVLGSSQDLDRNIVTWYDDEGQIELQRRRVHFDFTLTNMSTGATAEFIGHMVIEVDNQAGTLRIHGASRQLWVAGRLVAAVAGVTEFSDTGELNHGRSSLAEFEEAVCDRLAP